MRSRNIELIIYENAILEEKIDILDFYFGLEYAYILHDKDINENGELKKPHYHLRIFDKNQRTISAWSKLLKVKENEVEFLKNKKRAIRYLIHLDSPNKYQYSPNDVVSNINDIEEYFIEDKIDESNQLKYIFDYIENIKGYIYFREIKSYVLQNNYWGAYRRYYSIIKDVIQEHNRYCIDYMLN